MTWLNLVGWWCTVVILGLAALGLIAAIVAVLVRPREQRPIAMVGPREDTVVASFPRGERLS